MRPRDKTAEEIAEVARPKAARANPILRAAKPEWEEQNDEALKQLRAFHEAAKGPEFASLVNYAAAPLGGQTYDANWLATNTAAR